MEFQNELFECQKLGMLKYSTNELKWNVLDLFIGPPLNCIQWMFVSTSVQRIVTSLGYRQVLGQGLNPRTRFDCYLDQRERQLQALNSCKIAKQGWPSGQMEMLPQTTENV